MTMRDPLTASELEAFRLRKAASAHCLHLDLIELRDALAEARAALVNLDSTIKEAGLFEIRQAMFMPMASSS